MIKYDSGVVEVSIDVTDVKQINVMANLNYSLLGYVLGNDINVSRVDDSVSANEEAIDE